DDVRPLGRGDQRGGRAGARAEGADRQRGGLGLLGQPVDRADEAAGEQWDIEAQLARHRVDALLLGREQVHEERGEAAGLEACGDVAVARAEAAAARAVREDDDAARGCGQCEVAIEDGVIRGDADRLLAAAVSDRQGHLSALPPGFPPPGAGGPAAPAAAAVRTDLRFALELPVSRALGLRLGHIGRDRLLGRDRALHHAAVQLVAEIALARLVGIELVVRRQRLVRRDPVLVGPLAAHRSSRSHASVPRKHAAPARVWPAPVRGWCFRIRTAAATRPHQFRFAAARRSAIWIAAYALTTPPVVDRSPKLTLPSPRPGGTTAWSA